MKTKKVLLTGSSGFIGFHLLYRIVEFDWEIVCILRNPERLTIINKKVKKKKWDLSCKDRDDKSKINSELRGVTHVFHMAALIPTGENKGALKLFYEQNLINTINLITTLPENVRWFCYASTIDVYGIPTMPHLTEESPLIPHTYYAASKLATENLLKVYCLQNKIKLAILRLTQVYGPGDMSTTKLIPTCIKKVLTGEPLTIYGEGNDERDYLYVEDAAQAFLNAILSDNEGIFNIATGRSYKIIEVAEKIRNIIGSEMPISFMPPVKAMYQLRFDVRHAKEELLFQAKTTLEEGLKKTIEWERKSI